MCSSQSEPELSSSPPAVRTRKKIKDANYVFASEGLDSADVSDAEESRAGAKNQKEDDSEFLPSVNEDVVVKSKKRGRPRKSDQGKILKKTKNSSVTAKTKGRMSSNPADLNTSPSLAVTGSEEEIINLADDDTDDDLVESEHKTDVSSKLDVNSSVTIATPDQINGSYDMEEANTTPVKEMSTSSKIVHTMASAVAKSKSDSLDTHSPSASDQSHLAPALPSQAAKHMSKPTQSQALQVPRQGAPAPSPGTMDVKPGVPRMLRPSRPGMGRGKVGAAGTGYPRPGGVRRPRAFTGPRLSNPRSLTPTMIRSASYPQPQYYPVINQPVSSSQSDQFLPPSPSQSALTKLTSLGVGVSLARERAEPVRQNWVLPPGMTMSRTPTVTEQGPLLSISTLATAFHQLGEVEGRTRLVQLRLTEGQLMALNTLGLRQVE